VNVGSHRSRRRRRRGRGQGQGHQGGPQQPAAPQQQQQQQQQGPRSGAAHALGLPQPPPPLPATQGKVYEDLTSVDPQPRITLEYPGCSVSCRLVDLFCPIGRGQRGLIVSPPKAGKTTLLKDIGTSILRNHPDLELIVLLVDERPEEVTDFRRHFAQVVADMAPPPLTGLNEELAQLNLNGVSEPIPSNNTKPGYNTGAAARCHVIASSNDNDTDRHIAISTQTLEYSRQMVLGGRHVVILLDSLTRVGRSFNRSRRHSNSGRTLTGGIDSRALEVPKQIFGAARNTEEAGSLTIIASCLVDTGSQGDQVIFEEFKGTGNMELILDRKISERRLFPAINLAASGTRKEHLLMTDQEVKTITALRRRLMNMPPPQQVEQLLAAMNRFPTNAALVGSPA
jgi:transcription termination factor Rho